MSTIRTRLSAPGAGGPLRAAILVVGALALVALVAAVWFGIAWYRAAHDDSLALAQTREQVARDASQAAINLNSLDSDTQQTLRKGLDLWEQTATGPLLTELEGRREAFVSDVTERGLSSSAEVLDSAVADLNATAGSARVLVGVDVTYRFEPAETSCVRQRLELDMKRVSGTWKVAQLAPVGPLEPLPGQCEGTSPADPEN